jgi:hypothetical protein
VGVYFSVDGSHASGAGTVVQIPVTSSFSPSNVRTGHLETYLLLGPGHHLITLDSSANSAIAADVGSTLQVQIFTPFTNNSPSVTTAEAGSGYLVNAIAPSTPTWARGNFQVQTIALASQQAVRISADVALHGWNGSVWSSGGGPVGVYFTVDNSQVYGAGTVVQIPVTGSFNPSNVRTGHLETYVVLGPGQHTVALASTATSPIAADVGSTLQVQAFIPFPDNSPSVTTAEAGSGYSVNAIAPSTPTWASGPVQQQTIFLASQQAVRVSADVALHGWNGSSWSSGGGTVGAYFAVDGQQASGAGTVVQIPPTSSFNASNVRMGHLETYLVLGPGQHTIALVASPGSTLAADVGSTLQILSTVPPPAPFLVNNNSTLITSAKVLSGLTVSREVTVPSTGNEDFARTIDVFTNPTSSNITTTVHIVGNLGSDAATTVFATGSGDTTADVSDQWIGTDDADGTGSPAIIHYIRGPLGLKPTQVAVNGDNIDWTYNITVPAFQTIRLATFTILSNTRAGAIAEVNALFPNGGFGGHAGDFLSTAELNSLINFQVVGTTGSDSITIDPGSTGGTVKLTINGVTTDNFRGIGSVQVVGLGGTDAFTVDFGSALTTPLSIAGNNSSGDTLTVNGDRSPTNVIRKTLGKITWGSPVTETVFRSDIRKTVINANGTTHNYVNDPGEDTTINGGPGDNTITITATSRTGVVINGGPNANTYEVDLGSLAGPVTIQNNNGSATDNLIVNGADGDNTIGAAGNQVTAGTQTISVTSALSSLTINGGSGNNMITVDPLIIPLQSLVLNGGPADDTILVARTVTRTTTITAGSGGTDTLQGGGGTNTLVGSTGGGTTTFVDNGGTNAVIAGTGTNTIIPGTGHTTVQPPSGVVAPIVFNDGYTMSVNGTLNVAAAGVLANDFSANGQAISAVLLAGPTHGSVTLNANGSFQYAPTAGFAGADSKPARLLQLRRLLGAVE